MNKHLKGVSRYNVASATSNLNGASVLQFLIAVLAAVNALVVRKHPTS